jgi:hypothetical protein
MRGSVRGSDTVRSATTEAESPHFLSEIPVGRRATADPRSLRMNPYRHSLKPAPGSNPYGRSVMGASTTMARSKRSKKTPARRAKGPTRARGGFVGRDGTAVLDRYPPKDPSLSIRGPPPASAAKAVPAPAPKAATVSSATEAPAPLIALERPFDVDDFSSLLGETSIRVTVPREDLAEVLRRASEFMGFGIYVYAITVRPTPGDLLKSFVVELQRVDYSAEKGAWTPFVDKGASDSPFGPSGTRT